MILLRSNRMNRSYHESVIHMDLIPVSFPLSSLLHFVDLMHKLSFLQQVHVNVPAVDSLLVE
jgi:hypothetical protein